MREEFNNFRKFYGTLAELLFVATTADSSIRRFGKYHGYWRRFPYLDIQFCPTRPTVADWRTLSMVVVRFKSRKPNHGP